LKHARSLGPEREQELLGRYTMPSGRTMKKCEVIGPRRRGHTHKHTPTRAHARTRTHTRTLARAHYIHTPHAHTRTHAHTHTRTHKYTRTQVHANTDAHLHTRTSTRARRHKHTHAHTLTSAHTTQDVAEALAERIVEACAVINNAVRDELTNAMESAAAETAQRAIVKKVCPRVQTRVGVEPRSLQESVGSVEARVHTATPTAPW
jgi:hypothetical protein